MKHPDIKLTHIISDYRKQLASLPLNYSLLEKKQLSDVVLQKYELNSQTWSPQGIVSPQEWQHEVDIYIPDAPENKHALVVINNGTNYPGPGIPPSDISPEALARIAHSTETIVISVSNIPNQYLTYQGNPTPLAEDNSVAYT